MNLRKIFVSALFLGLILVPWASQAATGAWGRCPAITSDTTCGAFLYRTRPCTGPHCSPTANIRICAYAPCPLSANSAEFVEITGAPTTPNLTPNQEFTLTVKVKNTSNIVWPKQSLFSSAQRIYGYRLAFVNDSGNYTNIWDSSSSLTLNQTTATGSIATFSKRIKAPSRAGTYTLTLQMSQQNRGLFGPKSETKTYTVGDAADSKSIGSVDIANFNEAADAWVRGVSKAVDWVTTGEINRVKISICPVGVATCILAKDNNTSLDNVLNDDDHSLVTIPANSTYTQAQIKVEDKTNSSRFGLSPLFAVGSGNSVVLANPTLDSYSNWDIKTEMKKLSWDPKAFSSSYVEIWMCPSTVTVASSDYCFKSYGVNDAISNNGSRDIGLPLGVTPGSWKVFITGTTNGVIGSGFTPRVELVNKSVNIPNGFSNVLIEGVSGTAENIWTAGTKKNISWHRNGVMPSINLRICSVGSATCPYYLVYNSVQTNGVTNVTLPDNIARAPGAYFLKVENYTNPNQSAVSAPFVVGALIVPSAPTITDTSDWYTTSQTKVLKWNPQAFGNGTGNVDIWMCKASATALNSSNGDCINSYFGVTNNGEKQIGLPGNISVGDWKVYVKSSLIGNYDGAGFTPVIKLVDRNVTLPPVVYGSLRAASNQPSAGQVRIGSLSGNGWTSDYTHPQMNDTVCPSGTCTVSLRTTNSAYRFVANSGPQTCTGDANTGVRVCTFPRTTANISVIGTWELIPVNPPPAATGPNWAPVGSCSLPCGSGTQTWTCSGTACPVSSENRPCNTQACSVGQTPSLVVNAVGSGGEVILPNRDDGIVIEVANAFTGCSVSSKTTGSTPIPVSGSYTLPGTYSGHYFPKNAPGGAVDTDTVTLSCPNYPPKSVTVKVKPTIQANSFSAARRGDEILYKWKTTSGVKANAPDGSLSCTISQNNKYYEGRSLGLSNYTTATLNNVSNNQGGFEDKEQQKRVTGPCQSGIGGGHAIVNQACQIDASIICTSTNGLTTDRAYAQYNMPTVSNTY